MKKKLLNALLGKMRHLISNQRRILLIAPFPHHSVHLEPLVDKLIELSQFEVVTVGPFKKRPNVEQFDSNEQLSPLKHFDLVILTETNFKPWWLSCESVFFGHGIGPKLNYQTKNAMADFDYSFCPCQPIFESQQGAGINCFKIGLPILDKPTPVSTSKLIENFGINDALPTLVYAPSWCDDVSKISDIPDILARLATLTSKVNVIISPHPNLLLPERCGGVVFFEDTLFPINKGERGISTFDLCVYADFVVSDISSVLFESLALGKKTFFDGNDDVYVYCGAGNVLAELKKSVPTLNWSDDIEQQLYKAALDENFINQYLFNKGSATDAFIKAISEITRVKEPLN